VIVYLDTSALVKLYVAEDGADLVHRAVEDAAVVATCEVAYVEARAALARRHREHGLSRSGYLRAVRDLDRDWPSFFLLVVGTLLRDAAALADRYALRAYDALHLAAGLATRASGEPVTFACWDRTLAHAAGQAGLETFPN